MTGTVQISNEFTIDNPLVQLYGNIDYLFIVSFVLSIFAFIFTFSGITGEKESGTLRLIVANNVSRSNVLVSKIAGPYMVFLAPFYSIVHNRHSHDKHWWHTTVDIAQHTECCRDCLHGHRTVPVRPFFLSGYCCQLIVVIQSCRL